MIIERQSNSKKDMAERLSKYATAVNKAGKKEEPNKNEDKKNSK